MGGLGLHVTQDSPESLVSMLKVSSSGCTLSLRFPLISIDFLLEFLRLDHSHHVRQAIDFVALYHHFRHSLVSSCGVEHCRCHNLVLGIVYTRGHRYMSADPEELAS